MCITYITFNILKVYELRNILSLPKTVILGSTVIQVSTIWSEPGKQQSIFFFHNLFN